MSLRIEPKDSFTESELSLQETIRKLTRERDSALHQVAGLEVQVLELGQSKEDAITAIFQKGIAALREEFSRELEVRDRKSEEFKRLVAPLFAERQIRLEKEAAEKEAEEKEAALSFLPDGWAQRCKENLRKLSLDRIAQFREEEGSNFGNKYYWKALFNGSRPFPEEKV